MFAFRPGLNNIINNLSEYNLCINILHVHVYDSKLHGFFWITVQPFPCLRVFNGGGGRQLYLLWHQNRSSHSYRLMQKESIVIIQCYLKLTLLMPTTRSHTVLRLHIAHAYYVQTRFSALACLQFLFSGNEIKRKMLKL